MQQTPVCLYLARHLGPAAQADAGTSPYEARRAEAGETVLVLDDEPMVRILVTEVLGELGYAFLDAGTGRRTWRCWSPIRGWTSSSPTWACLAA